MRDNYKLNRTVRRLLRHYLPVGVGVRRARPLAQAALDDLDQPVDEAERVELDHQLDHRVADVVAAVRRVQKSEKLKGEFILRCFLSSYFYCTVLSKRHYIRKRLRVAF